MQLFDPEQSFSTPPATFNFFLFKKSQTKLYKQNIEQNFWKCKLNYNLKISDV